MLKITGLGSGILDHISVGAFRAFAEADAVVLQTDRLPCAAELRRTARGFYTLDRFFEDAEDFDALYESVADFIVKLSADQNVVFGVIGGIYQNGFLRALAEKTAFETIPGACFTCEALSFSGQYAPGPLLCAAARDLSALHPDASCGLVVTEIDNQLIASDVKLFLTEYYEDATPAVWVCGSSSKTFPLYELDRQTDFGLGAALVLPPLSGVARTRYTFGDLLDIMDRLRGPGGCPWDLEQTHETLRQYVLEEAYEVADAVDRQDPAALADELGDLLLQVVFHAQIGKQRGDFNITDVISNICAKMIARHPHIFGEIRVRSSEDVLVNWEAIKRSEKGIGSHTQAMEDIPMGMSALMRASKIQKKASGAGFDWNSAADAFQKVLEEAREFEEAIHSGVMADAEKEGGDLLFAAVNVLRLLNINPETALLRTNGKFIDRFRFVEQKAGRDMEKMTLAQLDELWEEAKRSGL